MKKEIYRFLNPRFQSLFLEYKVNLKPRYGYGNPPHSALYSIINVNRENYREFLSKALRLKENLWQIKDSKFESVSVKPTWNNGFLPGLDIIGLYTLMTEYKPQKYMEISSGNSIKVAFKAKQEQNLIQKLFR